MLMRMVQVAELLVTSVRRETMIQMIIIIAQPGQAANTDSCSAIHSNSVDSAGAQSTNTVSTAEIKSKRW